jgi:hypothetical protein
MHFMTAACDWLCLGASSPLSSVEQKAGVQDLEAIEKQFDEEAAREEDVVQERIRSTDEALRLQRVFPAGTLLSVRAYDPSGSGFGSGSISGERLSRLILGAREMYRCVL